MQCAFVYFCAAITNGNELWMRALCNERYVRIWRKQVCKIVGFQLHSNSNSDTSPIIAKWNREETAKGTGFVLSWLGLAWFAGTRVNCEPRPLGTNSCCCCWPWPPLGCTAHIQQQPKPILHNWTKQHPLNGPLSGTTQVSRYQKGKINLDFTGARDSGWQWHQLDHMQVCTSPQTDNNASTPQLSFFTGRMPFLQPNQQRQSTEGIAELYNTKHNGHTGLLGQHSPAAAINDQYLPSLSVRKFTGFRSVVWLIKKWLWNPTGMLKNIFNKIGKNSTICLTPEL